MTMLAWLCPRTLLLPLLLSFPLLTQAAPTLFEILSDRHSRSLLLLAKRNALWCALSSCIHLSGAGESSFECEEHSAGDYKWNEDRPPEHIAHTSALAGLQLDLENDLSFFHDEFKTAAKQQISQVAGQAAGSPRQWEEENDEHIVIIFNHLALHHLVGMRSLAKRILMPMPMITSDDLPTVKDWLPPLNFVFDTENRLKAAMKHFEEMREAQFNKGMPDEIGGVKKKVFFDVFHNVLQGFPDLAEYNEDPQTAAP